MDNYRFWLIFSDKPTTKRYIDEPINFADADFQLNRNERGMGLDASISGGELKFSFTSQRNHLLEDILYWFHKDGFEANVKFGFSIPTGEIFSGEIDFYTADTNDFDYIDCSVILDSEKLIFKRRYETKVDLFSSTTIDGEFIEPLQPIPMLLQAKPIEQVSEWQQSNQFIDSLKAQGNILILKGTLFCINPCQNQIKYGINNSFVFFNNQSHNFNDFKLLTAADNLNNLKIKLNGCIGNIDPKSFSIPPISTGKIDFKLMLRWGSFIDGTTNSYPDSTNKAVLLAKNLKTSDLNYTFDTNIEYTIGSINRGDNVWLSYEFLITPDGSSFSDVIGCDVNLDLKGIVLTSDSTAYNSTPLTFRLIDVMRYVVKSISGLNLNASRYDSLGEFYDTVLTNGKLLGGNVTDPFYISWEDIEKSIIGEHHADSEIEIDGRVFVGIEKDFFTNEECGFFDNTQFSGLSKKANPVYCLNKFGLKYSKYQSLKENTEPNSGSTIHGETILTPINKKVENSKELTIDWVRDAILLDTQQRLSTKVSDDTATQDDDTVFAIDTIENLTDRTFTETTELNHTWSDPYLFLRSNGDVNFEVIGIKPNTNFQIQAPDKNSGNYNVISVSGSELKLQRISGNTPSTANNGIRLTKYTYEIRNEDYPIINRTNEDFNVVLNLISPDKYSNLRYSVQRNIRNYWNSFLATVNLYHEDEPLKNTYYKNNGKCETEYNGLHITEKEDWIPTDPIMTPIMYESVIFANVDFADYLLLQSQLRTRRGFIRTIDNNNRVLKLYPTKMSYSIKSRELNMSGNEKFERAYMTIVKQNGIITVNDETKLRKLIYKVEEGNKIVLFDLERQRLYNGVYWDKISINGAYAETLEILKEWLDLLG